MNQVTELSQLILSAIRFAPEEEAFALAAKIREATERASIGLYARPLAEALPDLRTLDAFYTHASGDNGETYVDWQGLSLTFADGRKVALTDQGLCEMGEYLNPGSSYEENLRWFHEVQDHESSNPDADHSAAQKVVLARVLGVDPEQVDKMTAWVWEFIFACEKAALEGQIDLPAAVSMAEPD